MQLITEAKEIKKLHLALMKSLDKYSTEDLEILTGHRGRSFKTPAKYSKKLDIWWDAGRIISGNSGDRYWNAFGIGKPKEGKLAHIVCEINYPVEGSNNRIAASWVKYKSEYLLIHSGKIGGGRKGIGKTGFIENYNGIFENLKVKKVVDPVTIMGNLNDPKLPFQIRNFVFEASRIKNLLIKKVTTEEELDVLEKIKFTFNEEFSGTKEYKGRRGNVTATVNHGLVVNTLKMELESRNLLLANDVQRDLFIYNQSGTIETVFEVKTSMHSQSIFTAIGQLFVNNARLNPLPKLVFVIPETPVRNLSKTFTKLNVLVLVYSWVDNQPVFKNLEEII